MTRVRASRLRQHPRLEILEDRTLMSTCHVTRLSDSGVGKGFRGDLRYCINKVNAEPGPDTIDFTVKGAIQLTGALPDLSSDMSIVGPGSDFLTILRMSGGDYRIFTITSSVSVELSGLDIRNGRLYSFSGAIYGAGISNSGTLLVRESTIAQNVLASPDGFARGGGIHNDGSLALIGSVVTENTADSGWEAKGGGIHNLGDLTIIDSTVSGNFSTGNFVYAGGIYSQGVTSIYNSTIAYNQATSYFGDGAVGGIYSGGTLSIFNSTVASNSSDVLAGIDIDGPFTLISHSTISGNFSTSPTGSCDGIWNLQSNPFFIRNSIVAGNGDCDYVGELVSAGHNVFGAVDHGSGYAATDMLHTDPLLGPLADNGGPTLTMALLPGSPAIDAGDNTDAPDFDQRGPGFPRIVNGTIDIGSFEVQATGAPTSPDPLALLITMDFDRDD